MENIILVYDNIQNKTPILGLKVYGKNVSFASRKDLQKYIQEEVLQNQRPIQLTYKNQVIKVWPKDVGAKVDALSFTNVVLEEGRKGNIFQKLLLQNKALIGLVDYPIQGKISQALLTLTMLDIQDKINKGARPQIPDLWNDPNRMLPEEDGVKVNVGKLSNILLSNIFNPPQKTLEIPTIVTFPNKYSANDTEQLKKEYAKMSFAPITISSGGFVFTLSTSDLKSLLTVVERPDPKNPKKGKLLLRLDAVTLDKKLGEFAQKVEEVTHAEFDHHDAPVAIYSQFYTNTRRIIAIPTGRSTAFRKVLGASTAVQNGPKTAYLTFDDGPNSIYHPLVLDVLKTYGVHATFFLVGQNVQRETDLAKRTFAEGNVIGNHSLTHSFLPNYSSSSISKELQTTNEILKGITGVDTHLFRPPYGGVNTYVASDAQNLGLKMYLWDVDPRDWSEPETDDLVNRVVNNTFDGANILLHSNHLATVKALPKIIEKLQAQGYTFKTLSN